MENCDGMEKMLANMAAGWLAPHYLRSVRGRLRGLGKAESRTGTVRQPAGGDACPTGRGKLSGLILLC